MKALRRISAALFLVSAIAAPTRAETPKPLLSIADFETGNLNQLARQQASPDSITLVTTPVRSGRFAARMLLRASDPKVSNGQRSEFSDHKTPIEMDKDYWYGLSIFVPEDFSVGEKSDAVLFQWHTQQGGPSPVLAIRVRNGNWVVTSSATPKRRTLKELPLEKGRWTDWVVHVKWASAPTGFWTIWKDGAELVSEKDIITQYPETLGPYAKFGQYHSVDETPQNIVYVDEYRVAGPDGSYKDVAPPTTTPASYQQPQASTL